MSPEKAEALRRVVAYMWASEERDYGEQNEQGKARHVYVSLCALRAWLTGHGIDLFGEDGAPGYLPDRMDPLTRRLRAGGLLPGAVKMDAFGTGRVGRGAYITHMWADNGYGLSLGVAMDADADDYARLRVTYDHEVAVIVPNPGEFRRVVVQHDTVERIGDWDDVMAAWERVRAMPAR